MAYEIYLKKNEEKRIVAGHSWVYANEVARIEGKDKNGSLASVFSNDGRFIGKGYINHASKILVRIFIRGDEVDDREFYSNRLREAWEYRRKLEYENCCRVVFAEADHLPALIVDKYGDYLAVQCLSLGIDLRKQLIADCLAEIFHPKGVFERSDVALRKKEGLAEVKGTLYGEVPDEVEIRRGRRGFRLLLQQRRLYGELCDRCKERDRVRRFATRARQRNEECPFERA